MKRPLNRGIIRPKISTLPRQRSEAAAFLDVYKLTVEKKRLHQELETIEQRKVTIQQRLEALTKQIQALEDNVQQLREEEPSVDSSAQTSRTEINTTERSTFQTFTLDY